MKNIFYLLFCISIFFPGITLNAQVTLLEANPEIVYKTKNPDSTKLLITKLDLKSFCDGLNISWADSIECNPDKIWKALSDPLNFTQTYRNTRVIVSNDYDNPVLAVWSTMNEKDFTRFILFQRFFHDFYYFYNVDNLNITDKTIDEKLSALSAYKKFSADNYIYRKCNECSKTLKEALLNNEVELKKKGYTFLVIHPNVGIGYPFKRYNILTVKTKNKGKIIEVFKKLGLKVTDVKNVT